MVYVSKLTHHIFLFDCWFYVQFLSLFSTYQTWINRLIIKAIKKHNASTTISFECAATLAATYPHQRATPAPKAMAMGFLTEIVQRHNIHTDITPPKIAAMRLEGNGPLINIMNAERTL